MATMTTHAEIVGDLIHFFATGPGKDLERKALFELITSKLNTIAGEHWSHRYLEGVSKGQIQPSAKFLEAVNHLGSSLEGGRPAAYEGTDPVQVFALPGRVANGSLILAPSKPCGNLKCRVHFVPVVPWQKYCPHCRDPRNRL